MTSLVNHSHIPRLDKLSPYAHALFSPPQQQAQLLETLPVCEFSCVTKLTSLWLFGQKASKTSLTGKFSGQGGGGFLQCLNKRSETNILFWPPFSLHDQFLSMYTMFESEQNSEKNIYTCNIIIFILFYAFIQQDSVLVPVVGTFELQSQKTVQL